jgi:hypothetical protein
MNSLEELNDHSRTFVSITDDRPAGVILDRSKPYAFQFNENPVFIFYDGDPWNIEWDIAEIEEIPNWETANPPQHHRFAHRSRSQREHGHG